MFFYYGQYLTNVRSAEPTTIFQPDRVKPHFGNVLRGFDVDMYWLIPVAGIKEKPISTNP
jgi:hypothetical protein